MKKLNKIPIVMLSDKNYIFQTRVAIWSMRKNTALDSFLQITILCSSSLDNQSRQVLLDLQSLLLNLEIIFYEIDSRIFRNAKVTGHIPVASYYRLIIAGILEEDKCLFLDGDMIIHVDLNEIYSIEMGEDYIAGVKELGFLQNVGKAKEHMEKYGYCTLETYVNAGVMLFNLKEIRKNNLQEKFLKEIACQYTYMDQDIINKVCFGKIRLLELKYNVPACHVQFNKLTLDTRINKEQIKEAQKNWKILHFIGNYKPWENIRTWGAKIWWDYAKEALDEEAWKFMYAHALKLTSESDWTYILEKCRNETDIVIVGYTEIGKEVYYALIRCGIFAKFYFCDNSKEKREKFICENKILSVPEMVEKCPTALWVNTSQVSFREINKQLIELGVEKERIIIYKEKTELYYEMLSDEFRIYENEQLGLKKYGK